MISKTFKQKMKSIMVEKNAHDVKYLKTYGLQDAQGIIEQVNLQIDQDLMIVPPNSLSTVSERVHPLRWAGIREFLAVESHVSRASKEAVAAVISELNQCPYCQDAHEASLTALGDKVIVDDKAKALIEWGKNTRNPRAEIINNPPFDKTAAPEIIGTALTFHSTNRLVSIFNSESFLPGFLEHKLFKQKTLNFMANTMMKPFVEKKLTAGAALQFINKEKVDPALEWADSLPAYGQIFGALNTLLGDIERDVIPPVAAQRLKQAVDAWTGEDMPLGRNWLRELSGDVAEADRAILELMLLAAFTPYAITPTDIRNFKMIKPRDQDLLETCYWAIEILTAKISGWISKPFDSAVDRSLTPDAEQQQALIR